MDWVSRPARVFTFLGALLLLPGALIPQNRENGDPRELVRELSALRIDPSQVYKVSQLVLRRDVIRLTFSDGEVGFLSPLNRHVTGAVFTGSGHVVATPRDPAERRSLARFLGVPLLDQPFSSAYLRFTDGTAEELEQQLQKTGTQPTQDAEFAARWEPALATWNREHSLRILFDFLSANPQPYFYSGLVRAETGLFDVVVDWRQPEQVIFGQRRMAPAGPTYDIWASFPAAGVTPLVDAFAPISYRVETRIGEDLSLQGRTELRLKVQRGGERLLPLELSRFLAVDQVTDERDQPLAYFQNEEMNRREVVRRGNDIVVVALREPSQEGAEVRLNVAYHGSVISDAGNGVYYVGARGSWYPHWNGAEQFASFDLTFHWPRALTLVATGSCIERGEDGSERFGRWRSAIPISLAGFNLGEYKVEVIRSERPRIAVYANRELEKELASRLADQTTSLLQPFAALLTPPTARERARVLPALPPPSPADVLKRLGGEIWNSVQYFQSLNGPLPYEELDVSQIPGTFGQGWPGLVYLSTLAYLSPETQQKAGVPPREQEQITELMPFHEVAHQWWGNLVASGSYRDVWIEEAMANYMALAYADSRRPGRHMLQKWLDYLRRQLIEKPAGAHSPVEEAGPLSFGYRLNSSKAPDAYDKVIYAKGTWVIHMLREMMREPEAKDPDARFKELLRRLLADRRFQNLSTADLQHATESLMTPQMDLEGNRKLDWFFEEWVRDTGLPQYSVEFRAQQREKDSLISGKLKQGGVADTFLAAVPIYAARPGQKPLYLGRVVSNGGETSFRFASPVRPSRLLIDPYSTLLCRTN